MLRRILAVLPALFLCSGLMRAEAAVLDGVTFPDTQTVAGRRLVLNGTALRTYSILRVHIYVAALYLERPSSNAAQILAMRQLIFLWYAGAWPTVQADPGSPTGGQTFSSVLSADSYTQGLVWRVMQSHPMGRTTYNYGYWANVPAPLSAYLENPV